MSLINDALKRANEKQSETPRAAHPTQPVREPRMQPVETRHSSPVPIVLAVLLGMVLMGAGWFFWKSAQPGQKNVNASSVAIPAVTPAVSPKTEVTKSSSKIEELVKKTASSPQPKPIAPAPFVVVGSAPPAEPAAVPAPTATPAPTFPALKLQGIFYNPRNPTAVLNGKSYTVGGKISGARVVKIEQETVTVEWKGEERVLEMVH